MKRLTYLLLCLLMPAMAAAENAPVKYTDAASLTIVNKAQPGGPAFQRIDVARYPELTPTVTRYYRYSTGLAVVFRSTSTFAATANGSSPESVCRANPERSTKPPSSNTWIRR